MHGQNSHNGCHEFVIYSLCFYFVIHIVYLQTLIIICFHLYKKYLENGHLIET